MKQPNLMSVSFFLLWLFMPIYLFFLVAGCNKATKNAPDSGIEGQVLLGPMSAVVTQNSKPDQPYQATIIILDSGRKEINRIETDKEGRFKIALKPGEYILSPVAPNPPLPPIPEEKKAVVKPGEYTNVVLHFDTGIR